MQSTSQAVAFSSQVRIVQSTSQAVAFSSQVRIVQSTSQAVAFSSQVRIVQSTVRNVFSTFKDTTRTLNNVFCVALILPSLSHAHRGRLKHGRHFTYKSFTGEVAITLVCPGIHGTFADEDHPFAAQGPWLQVFISEQFSKQLLQHLEPVVVQQNVRNPSI